MSWFYIGEKSQGESRMTFKVVHAFEKVQEVGNPLMGHKPELVRIPQFTVDLETKNRDEARARVNYLNGGIGDHTSIGPSKSDSRILDA